MTKKENICNAQVGKNGKKYKKIYCREQQKNQDVFMKMQQKKLEQMLVPVKRKK